MYSYSEVTFFSVFLLSFTDWSGNFTIKAFFSLHVYLLFTCFIFHNNKYIYLYHAQCVLTSAPFLTDPPNTPCTLELSYWSDYVLVCVCFHGGREPEIKREIIRQDALV